MSPQKIDHEPLYIDTESTQLYDPSSFPMSASHDSVQSGVSTAGPVTPELIIESTFGMTARTGKSPVFVQEPQFMDQRGEASAFNDEGKKPRSMSSHRLPHHQFGAGNTSTTASSSSNSLPSVTILGGEKRPSYSDDPYGNALPHARSINLGDDFRDVPFSERDHKFTPPGSVAHTPTAPGSLSFDEKRPLTNGATTMTNTGDQADRPKKFTDSAAYWLILYFIFNLGLTLFNKVVLVNFPFPYVSRRRIGRAGPGPGRVVVGTDR